MNTSSDPTRADLDLIFDCLLQQARDNPRLAAALRRQNRRLVKFLGSRDTTPQSQPMPASGATVYPFPGTAAQRPTPAHEPATLAKQCDLLARAAAWRAGVLRGDEDDQTYRSLRQDARAVSLFLWPMDLGVHGPQCRQVAVYEALAAAYRACAEALATHAEPTADGHAEQLARIAAIRSTIQELTLQAGRHRRDLITEVMGDWLRRAAEKSGMALSQLAAG